MIEAIITMSLLFMGVIASEQVIIKSYISCVKHAQEMQVMYDAYSLYEISNLNEE